MASALGNALWARQGSNLRPTDYENVRAEPLTWGYGEELLRRNS